MDNLIPGTKYVKKVGTGQVYSYHVLLEGMEGMVVFTHEAPKEQTSSITKVNLQDVEVP